MESDDSEDAKMTLQELGDWCNQQRIIPLNPDGIPVYAFEIKEEDLALLPTVFCFQKTFWRTTFCKHTQICYTSDFAFSHSTRSPPPPPTGDRLLHPLSSTLLSSTPPPTHHSIALSVHKKLFFENTFG